MFNLVMKVQFGRRGFCKLPHRHEFFSHQMGSASRDFDFGFGLWLEQRNLSRNVDVLLNPVIYYIIGGTIPRRTPIESEKVRENPSGSDRLRGGIRQKIFLAE